MNTLEPKEFYPINTFVTALIFLFPFLKGTDMWLFALLFSQIYFINNSIVYHNLGLREEEEIKKRVLIITICTYSLAGIVSVILGRIVFGLLYGLIIIVSNYLQYHFKDA